MRRRKPLLSEFWGIWYQNCVTLVDIISNVMRLSCVPWTVVKGTSYTAQHGGDTNAKGTSLITASTVSHQKCFPQQPGEIRHRDLVKPVTNPLGAIYLVFFHVWPQLKYYFNSTTIAILSLSTPGLGSSYRKQQQRKPTSALKRLTLKLVTTIAFKPTNCCLSKYTWAEVIVQSILSKL